MNIEQIKAMSDDEVRRVIAALLGFTPCPAGGFWMKDSQGEIQPMKVWTSDLNAMADAEELLNTSMLRVDYQENLALLGPKDAGVAGWYWIHATARQRAEAFILTMQ